MDTQPLNSPTPEPPQQFPTPSASERDDTIRMLLALFALASFDAAVALFSLTKSNLQGETIGVVLGILGTVCLGGAYNYFFGSSSGSKSQMAQKEKQ